MYLEVPETAERMYSDTNITGGCVKADDSNCMYERVHGEFGQTRRMRVVRVKWRSACCTWLDQGGVCSQTRAEECACRYQR
jgi:hypothetical protein